MNAIHDNEYGRRLSRLQQTIRNLQADACIISTSVNQFYLLGHIFDGYIYLLPDGEPLLFVKRPAGITGGRVNYIRKPEQLPELLSQSRIELPQRVLVECDSISYSAISRLQSALGMPELINVSGEIRRIRSIKSEYELEQLRRSADIHAAVYRQIPHIYREGMTDIQFQIELEREMRLAGSAGIFRTFGENMEIFMGSILAGENAQSASPFDFALGGEGLSPLLPIGANGTKLIPGTTLMVDMAGNYTPWMSDMTRTFAIGEVPEIAHRAHRLSIDICNAIAGTARPGTPCADLYALAEEMVKKNGLADFFMGTKQQAKFVGHGIGLEINEPPVLAPRSKELLECGMTIAVEPKFVLPAIGAVGIENSYIVQQNGLKKITRYEEELTSLS